MIVRVQGEGQYELEDRSRSRLEELDSKLFDAIDTANEGEFRSCLAATLNYVVESGTPVADDRVVPSDVILPSSDTSLEEAKQLFTDEGLLHPVEA